MNTGSKSIAAALVAAFLSPWVAQHLGLVLSESERLQLVAGLVAAPAAIVHWIANTPVLARFRAWWSRSPTRELTPQQMAQVVQAVKELAVPVIVAKLERLQK